MGRRGTKERGGVRYRKRRVTGMRVGVAEEGSGNELAAQNHSCPDLFATRQEFSPLHSTFLRELRLRAGVSVNVPTVRSGVHLTPPVSHGRGIPSHTMLGVTCWRRSSCLPGQVSEPPSKLSPAPSNLLIGPVSRTGATDRAAWTSTQFSG